MGTAPNDNKTQDAHVHAVFIGRSMNNNDNRARSYVKNRNSIRGTVLLGAGSRHGRSSARV